MTTPTVLDLPGELPKRFVRGQNFVFSMELPPTVAADRFLEWTPTCQLRRLDNAGPSGVIAAVACDWRAGSRCTVLEFRFLAPDSELPGDTSAWPLGPVEFDVLFTHPTLGRLRSLPVRLEIVDGVTR